MAELEKEENDYQNLSEVDRDYLKINLRGFFADASAEDDFNSRYDNFRWYTDLVWSDLLSSPKDDFAPVAIGRQIVEAVLLNFEIKEDLLWYLYQRGVRDEEIRNLWAKVRGAFSESSALIGEFNGQPYNLAEAVKEFILIKSRGRDAVEMASFLDKLRQVFMVKDERFERFFSISGDEAARRLVGLIEFFIETTPEKINEVIDRKYHPEIFNPPVAALQKQAVKQASAASRPPIVASRSIAPAKSAPPLAPRKPTLAPMRPPYSEIKKKIEEKFEKNKEGEYLDLDGVFSALGKAAEKYNDPKIAELYYFDEKQNKFVWNT